MTPDCKCPMHERTSAECYCMCQHDGTDPCDQPKAAAS